MLSDQSNGGLTLLVQQPLAGVSGLGTDGSPVSIVNDRLLGVLCSSPLHPSPERRTCATLGGYRRSRARSCNKRRPRTRIHLPLIARNPALAICRRTPGKGRRRVIGNVVRLQRPRCDPCRGRVAAIRQVRSTRRRRQIRLGDIQEAAADVSCQAGASP